MSGYCTACGNTLCVCNELDSWLYSGDSELSETEWLKKRIAEAHDTINELESLLIKIMEKISPDLSGDIKINMTRKEYDLILDELEDLDE